jgi:exo-beta-1,3-glucanase (GH17 family)
MGPKITLRLALTFSRLAVVVILAFPTTGRCQEREKTTELPPGWRAKLSLTLWLDYSPTGFDPTSNPPKTATEAAVRSDLEAFRKIASPANERQLGIVLYGCGDGIEKVVVIASELKFRVILGIWFPEENEVSIAESLLRRQDLRDTVVAVCIGNETQTFRRCSLEKIRESAKRLRGSRRVPISTTEVIQRYGNEELLREMDFLFPNVHPLFAMRPDDPVKAGHWTLDQVRALKAAYPDTYLLVKECGWPAGPMTTFDEEQQATYWKTVLGDPVAREVNFCVFESSFDARWKHEWVSVSPSKLPSEQAFRSGNRVDVGPFWSVFGAAPERRPRKTFESIMLWWDSRTRAAR